MTTQKLVRPGRTWYVDADGVREDFDWYPDATAAYEKAAGKQVALCRGDGTLIDCKGTENETQS